MKAIAVALFTAGCLASLSAAAQDNQQPVADAPVPPEQSLPWIPPPTRLPPGVTSAVEELFEEGLADPRGCEYREIAVGWGENTIETHGWIISTKGGTAYAVGWDGLVYPLKSVGQPADLMKDCAAQNPQEFAGIDDNWLVGENRRLATESLVPIKVALLLRLGQAGLAEDFWRRRFARHAEPSEQEPYVLLANLWLSALYNRAVWAHQNGDNPLALATCRFLLPLQSRVEASAARRGIPKPAEHGLYVEALAQLPELAADEERRAREPVYVPVLDGGQPTSGPERIAALIRDLELVSVYQMMNPGQTDVYGDPIVQALIKEGDPAVEPLLKCWEEDLRLTRTQFSQGMMFGGGPIVHVYEAAYIALDCILEMPFYFSAADDKQPHPSDAARDPRDEHPRELTLDDRRFLGAKMRAYWDEHKNLTLPERWFAVLQDDRAGAEAWFKAAKRIVEPPGQEEVSFGIYGGSIGWGFPLAPGKPMNGESLRGKSDPSVSDLMIKRLKQLMPRDGADSILSSNHFGIFILALADWDGKAHLGEIRDFAQAFHARFPPKSEGFTSTRDIEISIYQRRLYWGDSGVLQDDADWLATLLPKDLSSVPHSERPFQIMWHHPNDPIIQRAAAGMLTGKDSPWVPLPNVLVPTPLIGLESFRQELARGLDDSSPEGTVKVEENSVQYDYQRTGGARSESPGSAKDDPLSPGPGSVVTFRLCDCYAYQLSQVDGFPACKLYWPEKQRDAAVAACKAFLRQYGDAY